jgi:tRNA U34 5-carboxymethylaminomethyl modifying GTPase MnmE/TrmE
VFARHQDPIVAIASAPGRGAVGMVRMAIEQLEREGVVKLGEADRVHLVGNLLTVLVSDNETHPVISVDKAN